MVQKIALDLWKQDDVTPYLIEIRRYLLNR